MNFPFCNKELIPGYIYGGSYGINHSLRWLPESRKPTLETLELESETIGKNTGGFSSQTFEVI